MLGLLTQIGAIPAMSLYIENDLQTFGVFGNSMRGEGGTFIPLKTHWISICYMDIIPWNILVHTTNAGPPLKTTR